MGILVESFISLQLGALGQSSFNRIKNILAKYSLPLRLPDKLSPQTLLDAMVMDKKTINRKPRFVILQKIGSPLAFDSDYCTAVEESLIRRALIDLF